MRVPLLRKRVTRFDICQNREVSGYAHLYIRRRKPDLLIHNSISRWFIFMWAWVIDTDKVYTETGAPV